MTIIDQLLRPRRVAIIGASVDQSKLTGRPLAYLRKYGFTGEIYPVNPRYDAIDSIRCYPDIQTLPQPPDVAIVLLGGDKVVDTVRQLADLGTAAAIILASGFGEGGVEGKARQDALRSAAGNMRILGPNTIGLVNVTERIVLSASNALVTDELVAGSIALVSQSGGILGSLLSRADAAGIGFSKLIATGNECDLEVSDFIDYLVDDPATRLIALYLEGLRNPKAFRATVFRARAAGKPIVVFKVGRSEAGARSVVSHTGALAGSDAAYDALFRQFGVLRAERFSDLLDIPIALTTAPPLTGRRIAIVTSTGGAASLLADAMGRIGLEAPPPDEETATKLKSLAIDGATLDRNPIDVTLAGVRSDIFATILDILIASPSYDAIAVVLGSSALRDPEIVSDPLRACAAKSRKPIIGFTSPHAPQLVRRLNQTGVPTYADPESCAVALSALLQTTKRGLPHCDIPAVSENCSDVSVFRTLLRPGTLNEAESKRLFAHFNIPTTSEVEAATPAEAETAAKSFSGPVVVKALSRHITHKSEAGGVAVNVRPEDVSRVCAQMTDRFVAITGWKPEGFLIQELVTDGIEMILGCRYDPQLGPLILLGMGGVGAELYRDTTLRLAPVDANEARAMIDELKVAALLKGFRGRPPADIESLVAAVVAFSTMAAVIGHDLQEAEVNPLFVRPAGQGVIAADGVAIVNASTL